MKQRAQLATYLVSMTVLIAAMLFVFGSKGHNICPVCNHSIAKEGLNTSILAKQNQ